MTICLVEEKEILKRNSKKKSNKSNKSRYTMQQNTYTITIKQPWFNLIQSGQKTIEGRLNRGLFSRLQVGNKITWIHKNLKCNIIVSKITKYRSFKEMLETEGLNNVLPTIDNIDDGIKIYRQYYTEQDETNGVIAIKMNLDNNQNGGNIHESKLQSPYYEYIRDGIKIYELRVNDDKIQKMNIGDKWIFTHNIDRNLPEIRTKIIDKKIYKSFEDAIDDTKFLNLLPNAKSNAEAIQIYNAFGDGAYERDAKIFGVVRFTLQLKN